jgi:hypothetical protein
MQTQPATPLTLFVSYGFIGQWEFEPLTHNLTRARVAYLLRAARSRRAGNVTRTPAKGYQLNDCCYIITRVPVAILD